MKERKKKKARKEEKGLRSINRFAWTYARYTRTFLRTYTRTYAHTLRMPVNDPSRVRVDTHISAVHTHIHTYAHCTFTRTPHIPGNDLPGRLGSREPAIYSAVPAYTPTCIHSLFYDPSRVRSEHTWDPHNTTYHIIIY
jgi:hypothetical protein